MITPILQAIIVDDEPKAIDLLKLYASRLPNIEMVDSFRNPLDVLPFLNRSKVDLIFLDINMPQISGIDLAKILSHKSNIIFTTAYQEYAVDSYNLGGLDYLLKPISFERFVKCIQRIENSITPIPSSHNVVSVKSGNATHLLPQREILYMQKDGNYMYYFLDGRRKIMARESINEALNKLGDSFFQVHKSYIINAEHIDSYGVDWIKIEGQVIPISALYKNDFSIQLKRLGLV